MKVLLIGVLLGLLHGGLPENFFHPFLMRAVPTVVRGPFGNEKPIVYTYYVPFPVETAHPRSPPLAYMAHNRAPNYNTKADDSPTFNRGHIEAHPHSFRHSVSLEDGRIPLRDSVEKIPIEGQMNILRKSSIAEGDDNIPFSRGDVEALPSPQIVSYSSVTDFDTQAMLYSVQNHREDIPLIGYRKDVESTPSTPNINPFAFFYPGLDQRFSSFDYLWRPQSPVVVEQPLEYKTWNSPINFMRQNGGKKVVCYYESWASYRPHPNNFDIQNIDPFACSHLIYTFAGIDNNTYEIISLDQKRDIIQGAYKSAVALKASNPHLKVLIAVGGWAEGGKKYSDMVSSQATRDAFVNSVNSFMMEHGFDGLDLDWEYPGASDRGGKNTDKDNTSLLVEQLKEMFQQKGWILTMAIPPAERRIDEGYDLMRLSKSLDFFNLMVYDLRGPWDGFADHHAPFLPKSTDTYLHNGLNLKSGVQLFVNHGVPREKIIVGTPFYGRSFTLEDPSKNTPGSRIKGPGNPARYTQEKGYIAYYEICASQRNGGWMVNVDEAGGKYMVKEDQWIGYDDEKSIETKVNFVKYEDFGGVMVWAIDLDDYLGLCDGTRWPLLSTVRKVLYSPKQPGYEQTITPKPTGGVGDKTTTKTESPSPNSEIRETTTGKNKTTASGPTGTNIAATSSFNCPKPGYYRTRSSCRLYFICDEDNRAYRFECPEGMAFDMKRRLCRWQSLVTCGEEYSPLTHTRSVICGEDGLFSHPLDCKKYVWCKNGEGIEVSCPLDLYFDSRKGICAPKNDTLCIQGEMAEAPGGEILKYSSGQLGTFYRTRSDGPKVMCYFANWAFYRPKQGQFVPEHIDPKLCTHIVYCFANLDTSELMIRSSDPWIDLEHGFYERILKLREKNPELKVLLSLGGWTDSAGSKYSRLVNNPEARARFVTYTTELLIAYSFDGLELHWEHPVCWQINCRSGLSTDKQGYAALIRELRHSFTTGPVFLELAVAISPARAIIKIGYDIRTISANADYMNVMTYDYHGFWEKKTGHVSPLYYRQGDKHESQNTDFSINYIIQAGADPSKINVGIPLYSQTFKLVDIGETILNSPVSGPGNEGAITLQKGMMSYHETCQQIRLPGWRKAVDNKKATGPYAFKDDQWLSFDDAESIDRKGKYILDMKLAGGMVWTVDFDDFPNDCCQESFPLLRALNRALLRTVPYPLPRPGGQCSKAPSPITPPPPIQTTTYAGKKPKKPSTDFGDLLANTTQKTTAKWQTTRPITSITTPTTTATTKTTLQPSNTSTTAAPPTTTSTTPRTTSPIWWWTSPTTSKQKTPVTTTTSTTTTTTTTTTPTTTTTLSTTSPIWWWVSPTTSSATTSTTTTPRTTKRTTWWWTPPSTTTTTPFWHWPPSTATTQTPPTTTTKQYYETSSMKHFGSGSHQVGMKCTSQQHYAPDLTDCSKFLRCSKGKFVEATCIPGLHWNKHKEICDWPENAGCQSTDLVKRPTPSSTTKFPVTSKPSSVVTTPDIFWWTSKPTSQTTWQWKPTTGSTFSWTSPVTHRTSPSQLDAPPDKCRGREKHRATKCNQYYECVVGHLQKRNCAPGLHWNEKKGMCDWPVYAECVLSIRKPTTPSSVDDNKQQMTPGAPSGPAAGDPCSGSQMIPKPGSCTEFLICNQGVLIESNCAVGLHWNKKKRHCDWPDSAKCHASKKPISSDPHPSPEVVIPGPVHPPVQPPQSTVSLETAPQGGPLSGDFLVVCYFTNWSRYRPGRGKFLPEDIDASKCTHIVYGFAVLDYSNLIIKPHDSWADIDLNSYTQVTQLQAKGKKVTLAIGGWNDSAGDKYSRLLNNPEARARFIDHVIGFLEKYNFDGLDLDYEYPACPQVDCNKGNPNDKAAFAAFVRELSAKFKPKGFLLSAAVSPSKKVIDAGYDVPALSQYLDWIAVMTYDFHGHWDKKTGHVAPMYHHPDDDIDYFNMDFAIRYWLEKGASPKKIVLGMPLYGQSFTLNDPNVNGLNAPASQKGLAGPYTRAAGFLAYYEICKNIIQDGWTVVKDPKGRMGPYAYRGNQWVSYDDIETIQKKSMYIREMGLGGGMVWALDLDDFRNECGQGKYPLMKTIQSVLGPAMDHGHKPIITDKPQEVAQPMPPPSVGKPTVVGEVGTKVPKIPPQDDGMDLKVVCYFTNWATYRPGEGKYGPSDAHIELCSHINYGFVVLDEATLTLKPHDKWIDIDNSFFELVVALKQKNINLKVLVALGGWNDSKGSKYSDLVHDPQARKRFNEHALGFIEHYKFDGMDLDWEYPACPQVDCAKGRESDKEAFIEWIKELKMLFEPRGLLLTAAVSPSFTVIDRGYDVPALSQYLDFINVMTYDYHGQWDKKTGHFSPLYVHPGHDEKRFNADFTIKYWIQKGADPKKLIMGMGMYGQSFTLSQSHQNDLGQPASGGGEAGPYTRARGFLAYYEICYFIKHESWTVVRDPQRRIGPYAYKGNQWVGFDDIPMIRMKSKYIRDMGLGGGMIWALDLDDFKDRCSCEKHPLLRTINRVLRPNTFQVPDPQCPLLGEETISIIPTIPPTIEVPTVRPPKTTTSYYIPEPITPAPAHEKEPHQYPDPSVGTEGASCQPGEFKRHSYCGKFYECYKGKLREVSCHRAFQWDGKGRCVPPEKAKCTSRISSQAVAPPTIFPRPEEPVALPPRQVDQQEFGAEGQPCNAGELKKHPTSCDKFFECLHNTLRERQCFPGLHWDGKGRCTWPNQANCQVGIPQIPSLPETVITPIHKPHKKVTSMTTTASTTTSRTTTKRDSTQWYVPWTPSTKPTTPRPTHPPGPLKTTGKKVVCYFTNWAWYRPGLGKYRPEDVDTNLCTHILYGFAVLDGNNLVIKPHDSWADIDNEFYQKVTGLKAQGKKVLVAIGGWNDSKGDKYSRLVNNPSARAKFIAHILEFIEKYNFDGLDLDWEYPKCWQVDCKKGPDSDKDGFSAWMRELSAAFKPRNLLLSAAISPSKVVIDHAYYVPDLIRYLDFVNVMTYDYHGHWDKQTGHVAPLYYHDESINEFFNANYTIHFLLERGAEREKLIMGMPMYGQAFTLKDASKSSLNSPANKGRAGQYTRAAGFLAYYEICHLVKNEGYKVVRDPQNRIGPYAYKGNQWVGFDDAKMIQIKSEYIMKMGLGGGMIWALDLDDFNNRCNCEPHPLLRTINRVLRGYSLGAVPDCSL